MLLFALGSLVVIAPFVVLARPRRGPAWPPWRLFLALYAGALVLAMILDP